MAASKKVRHKTYWIGSRGSLLALKQAQRVRKELIEHNPGISFKIKVIKTRGDQDQSLSVFDHAATGIFTKEIERYLLNNKIHFAVHSLKDIPTLLPKGLGIAAYLKRENPRDTLLTRNGSRLEALKSGAFVATSSPRRQRQLHRVRPDIRVIPMRGNLTTRIRRLKERRVDALIVARAGLDRIKNSNYIKMARDLHPSQMLPCVGQGIIALETRTRDKQACRMAQKLNHLPSQNIARVERTFLNTLRGGCRVPVGVHTTVAGSRMHLKAVVLSIKHTDFLTVKQSRPATQAAELGRSAARSLLRQGAKRYIHEARFR